MTVGRNELSDLVGNMVVENGKSGTAFITWIEESGIDPEAFGFMIHKLEKTLTGVVVNKGFSGADAIRTTIAVAFRMGWEAHRQYGDESQ